MPPGSSRRAAAAHLPIVPKGGRQVGRTDQRIDRRTDQQSDLYGRVYATKKLMGERPQKPQTPPPLVTKTAFNRHIAVQF